MIKVILFDLDDTLLDFQKSEATALRKALIKINVNPTNEIISRYNIINANLWKKLELGEMTREQILVERFKILFKEFKIDNDPAKMKKTYENFLAEGHFFVPGALEVLKTLYKSYDLYIASNGTAKVQKGRISSANIEKYFKDIFISQNIGYVKPQKEFFEYCFSKMPKCSKNEIIIVGDSLSSDILGGNNAGIKTCWYNPKKLPNKSNADVQISNLNDLPSVLKDL